MHAAVLELLLELVAGILETSTSGLNVVYANTDMAEALSRLLVSIGDFEVRVILSSWRMLARFLSIGILDAFLRKLHVCSGMNVLRCVEEHRVSNPGHTIIVGEFNDALSVGPVVVVRNRFWGVVGKKVH